MAARKGNSRDNILDAAETLFAEDGFDLASIRDIVSRSGDTLGTLNYHFASKDKLLQVVIQRRFADLDRLRECEYNRVKHQASERPLILSEVVEAIMAPFVRQAFGSDSGWRSYIHLMSRMVRTSNPTHRQFITDLRDPYTNRYIGWMRSVLPERSECDLRYAYDLMISVMVAACSDIPLTDLTDLTDLGDPKTAIEKLLSRLIAFVTAGISNLLQLPRESD